MKQRSLFVKVAALLCVLVLLCAALTGCGLPQGSPGDQETEPTQVPTGTPTVPTEPSTQPSQPDDSHPTDSVDVLVEDMVDDAIISDRYRLPYVSTPGYEAVNQAIREQLLWQASEEGWDDIGYMVGESGDVVSILVRCEGFSDDSAYYTYHFARSTGKLLERADVLRQFGLNAQTFCELAEERTLDYFESYYQELKDNSDPALYEELWEITKEGTLDNTQVFVDRNGNLGFIARIGAIAGATYDNLVLGCWEDTPVEDVNFHR